MTCQHTQQTDSAQGSTRACRLQRIDFYSQEYRYLLRRFDTKLLKKKYASSYFDRIVDEWNSLPLEASSACSVDMLKSNDIKFVTKIVNIVTNSVIQFFVRY